MKNYKTIERKNRISTIVAVALLAIVLMSVGSLIRLKQIEGSATNGTVIKTVSGASTWDSLAYADLRGKILTVGASGTVPVSNGTTYVNTSPPWTTGNFVSADLTASANRTHSFAANNLTIQGTNWAMNGSSNGFGFKGGAVSNYAYFSTTNLTTGQLFDMPNLSGTIATLQHFPGGSAGQVLTKMGATVGDWAWQTPSGGGATLGTNTTVAITVASGNISGSTVTLAAGQTALTTLPRNLFVNGVKAPNSLITFTGTNWSVSNTSMPFPIAVGDYCELQFNY